MLIKRLQYGATKCYKLHCGKSSVVCPDLKVDTWKLVNPSMSPSSILELVDQEGDPHTLETVPFTKYLGDFSSADGKNDKNIEERFNKGNGKVSEIFFLLEDLCLGKYFFESGNILRNSLLLSSLLSNSESWYNVTPNQVEKLERVDEYMLRKMLYSHSKVAKELLYLETGNIPCRFVLMARRLNFLWYMLHLDRETLLRSFLQAQIDQPSVGDWITTVLQDIETLNLNINLEGVVVISKTRFKKKVKQAITDKAFEYLVSQQATHSKSKPLKYSKLKLQPYLQADGVDLTIKEKAFIFEARSRMIDIRDNFKTGKSDLRCRACNVEVEDQPHLLQCTKLTENGEIVQEIPKYSDLFGEDPAKIAAVSRILQRKFTLLKSFNNQSAPTTVSVTYTSTSNGSASTLLQQSGLG